jgi:plastocyanin
MFVQLLAALCVLLAAAPAPAGGIAGRVTLSRNGAPLPDASNAVVWLESVRKAETPGVVKGQMESARKRFTPRVVAVPSHTAVDFPNVDPIFHNVFSVSGANRFDLGLYRSGASKKQQFDTPGLVRVYCNIHPQMVGFVRVVESDFYAVTGPDGAFRLDGVPVGTWTLKVWHEEGGESEARVTVRPRETAASTLALDTSTFKSQPHLNKYGKPYPPPPPDDERY